ncbi:MAG: NnrU family protein [Pseudomonadota bacterium]
MSLIPIAFASALLLLTHLGFSGPLRPLLVSQLGERGFLIFFTLTAALTLAMLIWMFGQSPRTRYFWYPSPENYLLSKVLAAPAMLLLAGALLVRNPSALGQGALAASADRGAAAARGIHRITRHPLLWAVVFWSVSHLVSNGDRAAVVFFGTFLALALLGTFALDARKNRAGAPGWAAFRAATSNVPCAALLSGRSGSASGKRALAELIGPLLLGAVLYAVGFYGHRWLGGVDLY